eukprot:SAG11_NODE_18739_length_482_cov_1.699739_1_plen_91_part_01
MLRVGADVACVEVDRAQGGAARATVNVAQVAKLVALEAAAPVGAMRREAEWTGAQPLACCRLDEDGCGAQAGGWHDGGGSGRRSSDGRARS